MPGKIFIGRELDGIVEGQLRRWEISEGEKTKLERQAHLEGREIHYITISRQLGSGGGEVSRQLSKRMKWQLYDKQILDYMSENMNVHKSVLEHLDLSKNSWIEDLFGSLFSDNHIAHASYYRHLVKVLFAIAQNEDAIIVGRAAGMVLPRDKGLSVRITAPFELRCERYAQKENITLKDAKAKVSKADAQQKAFVKNFINKDVAEASNYDLVCNTETMKPDSVAKLIWRAFDQRLLCSESNEPLE